MNTMIFLRRKARDLYRSSPIKSRVLRSLYFKLRKIRDRRRKVIKKVDGIIYELDLSEFIDSEIYYYGCFEEDTANVLRRLLKPGMTVVDVGANIGAHALPMAKLVGHKGRVIAFEPMADAHQKLLRNLSLNSFTNVIVEKIALSNESHLTTASFRTSWNIYDRTQPGVGSADVVPFETLDNYILRHDFQTVDLIKVDVDGFEYKVLQGGCRNSKPLQTSAFD